ncbi:MAG: cytochrome b/b6 domain-containing protein [Desulfobacteraceae bacterium]|jgi:cytochrome b|nr:cytochrome b/b6 domain-containing protein [Desulfobacteraceae bacterium]
MDNRTETSSTDNDRPAAIPVWDLPTRLFHWLLVVLVALSFATGSIGGNAMQYHEWSGFAILIVLVFRIIWGFVGSRTSRFSYFVKGPATLWRYAAALVRGKSERYLGHNPLGGWSVLAMLLVLLGQAATGLFANDDIITEGPLYLWVSKPLSDWLSAVHRLNRYLIMVLVATHVSAVLFYLLVKRENLIKPMISGVKHWRGGHSAPPAESNWLAAVIAAIAGLLLYILVY